MHLGNVEFQAGGKTRSDSESSIISEEDAAIKTMASLLEIDEAGIRKWLCYRQIITARETFVKPMNTEAVINKTKTCIILNKNGLKSKF